MRKLFSVVLLMLAISLKLQSAVAEYQLRISSGDVIRDLGSDLGSDSPSGASSDYSGISHVNASVDSVDHDLQLIVCKELAAHQECLKRRQNSGITHGYLIDYNRL